jgi:3-dehydroquinate synthase
LIYRCAELHLQHIATSGDPFESGSARPLDFGHWSAHKLEQLSGYRLRHGEAVAIGIALDTTYSCLSGFLSEPEWRRVLRLLLQVGFAVHAPELSERRDQRDHPRCILQGLREFREHLGGELTITLLERIGRGFEAHAIDEPRMVQSIALLERLGRRFGATPAVPTRSTEPRIPSQCDLPIASEGEAAWKYDPHRRSAPVP